MSLGECMVMKWRYETTLTPFFFYFLVFRNSLGVEYTVSVVWVGGWLYNGVMKQH
jgi:hypothetical protein